MPITQIQSAGAAAISAQIQAKTSPQGTPAGQPTPILPNTPLSPPSGMTTVTLNTRPILPQQQQQQQRKISAGKLSETLFSHMKESLSKFWPELHPSTNILFVLADLYTRVGTENIE